jgi:hypothetical protein
MSAGLQEGKRLRPASVDSPSIGISALRLVAFPRLRLSPSPACGGRLGWGGAQEWVPAARWFVPTRRL